MNVIDRIVGDRLRVQIELEKAAARREGFEEGYSIGCKSMKEHFAETGRLGTNEDTHKLSCPQCCKTIAIPCLNYSFASMEEQADE